MILIGTNDIGYPGSYMPEAAMAKKISAYETGMSELVQRVVSRGTIPILTTLPPRTADLYPKISFVGSKYADLISRINDWLRAFAAGNNYPIIDFHEALCQGDDPSASLSTCRLGGDGVHPSRAGYDLRNQLTMTMLYRLSAVNQL